MTARLSPGHAAERDALTVSEFRREREISLTRWRQLVLADGAPPLVRRGRQFVITSEAARAWDTEQRYRLARFLEAPVIVGGE